MKAVFFLALVTSSTASLPEVMQRVHAHAITVRDEFSQQMPARLSVNGVLPFGAEAKTKLRKLMGLRKPGEDDGGTGEMDLATLCAEVGTFEVPEGVTTPVL
jgi:hypothetical protein